MAKEIKKIYWVNHPTFVLQESKRKGWTPQKLFEHFIGPVIHPLILQAEREPDSLVVFVKSSAILSNAFRDASPERKSRFSEQFSGYSSARIRKMLAIEKRLERFMRSHLQERCVVSDETLRTIDTEVADIGKKIAERGFILDKKVHIKAYGGYEGLCLKNYPNMLIEQSRRGRVSFPRGGSLSDRQAFKTYRPK